MDSNKLYTCTDEALFARNLMKVAGDPFFKTVCRHAGRDDRVLEAGCGMAYCGFALSGMGINVTALDISEKLVTMLNDFKGRLAGGSGDKLKVVAGDIFDLERYNGSFDLVFNNGVLEHFPTREERAQALGGIARCLRKNGKYIVGVPNIGNPLFGMALTDDFGVPKMHGFTEASLEDELRDAGFTVIEKGYVFVSVGYEQWLKSSWLKAPIEIIRAVWIILPAFLRKALSAHFYCVAGRR
jgi:SAM-dependent methyltransferase